MVVDQQKIELIIKKLEKVETALLNKQRIMDKPFVDSQEFLQLMSISKRTAQTWRDSGIIPFLQVGGKIYYRRRDIEDLLQKNYYAVGNENFLNSEKNKIEKEQLQNDEK